MHHAHTRTHTHLCIISATSSHLFTTNLHLQVNSLALVAHRGARVHKPPPLLLSFYWIVTLSSTLCQYTQLLSFSTSPMFEWVSIHKVTNSLLAWIRITDNAFVCGWVSFIPHQYTDGKTWFTNPLGWMWWWAIMGPIWIQIRFHIVFVLLLLFFFFFLILEKLKNQAYAGNVFAILAAKQIKWYPIFWQAIFLLIKPSVKWAIVSALLDCQTLQTGPRQPTVLKDKRNLECERVLQYRSQVTQQRYSNTTCYRSFTHSTNGQVTFMLLIFSRSTKLFRCSHLCSSDYTVVQFHLLKQATR